MGQVKITGDKGGQKEEDSCFSEELEDLSDFVERSSLLTESVGDMSPIFTDDSLGGRKETRNRKTKTHDDNEDLM